MHAQNDGDLLGDEEDLHSTTLGLLNNTDGRNNNKVCTKQEPTATAAPNDENNQELTDYESEFHYVDRPHLLSSYYCNHRYVFRLILVFLFALLLGLGVGYYSETVMGFQEPRSITTSSHHRNAGRSGAVVGANVTNTTPRPTKARKKKKTDKKKGKKHGQHVDKKKRKTPSPRPPSSASSSSSAGSDRQSGSVDTTVPTERKTNVKGGESETVVPTERSKKGGTQKTTQVPSQREPKNKDKKQKKEKKEKQKKSSKKEEHKNKTKKRKHQEKKKRKKDKTKNNKTINTTVAKDLNTWLNENHMGWSVNPLALKDGKYCGNDKKCALRTKV